MAPRWGFGQATRSETQTCRLERCVVNLFFFFFFSFFLLFFWVWLDMVMVAMVVMEILGGVGSQFHEAYLHLNSWLMMLFITNHGGGLYPRCV